MNNGSYIHILFFPLALPRANDMDVESFVALFLFLGFFVLFLDVFFLFFSFYYLLHELHSCNACIIQNK